MTRQDLKRKQTQPASLRSFQILTLTATVSAAFLSLGVSSCQVNPTAPNLRFKAPIYAADSRTQTVVRGKERIKTSDKRFDQMLCTTQSAYNKSVKELTRLSYLCEKWADDSAQMQFHEAMDALEKDL